MVISGHTHNAYNCLLPNSEGSLIPVTSASSFGRLVTDIDMTINRKSGRPCRSRSTTRSFSATTPMPTRRRWSTYYKTAVAPIANAVVGAITADITRTNNANGESALGDVIADAQLAYTQSSGAQFAFMNPGGIRASTDLNAIGGGRGARRGHVRRGLRRPTVQQPCRRRRT